MALNSYLVVVVAVLFVGYGYVNALCPVSLEASVTEIASWRP